VTGNQGFRRVSENCLLAVHQIVQHEDAIVCANTGLNCITVVRKGRLGTTRKHYHPTVNRWDVAANGEKANRFNSVLIFEGIGGVHEIRLLDEADECHPNVLSLPEPWRRSQAAVSATTGASADRHASSTEPLSAR